MDTLPDDVIHELFLNICYPGFLKCIVNHQFNIFKNNYIWQVLLKNYNHMINNHQFQNPTRIYDIMYRSSMALKHTPVYIITSLEEIIIEKAALFNNLELLQYMSDTYDIELYIYENLFHQSMNKGYFKIAAYLLIKYKFNITLSDITDFYRKRKNEGGDYLFDILLKKVDKEWMLTQADNFKYIDDTIILNKYII
jgi:hypothetical protein